MEGDFSTGYLVGSDRNNNNGGFGDGFGSWIWVILIIAIFGGFGGRGGLFGGNGGGADWQRSTVQDSYVLASDFANIERKIDGVNNGICSLGYDQLAQMNGINQNISNLGYQLQNCCCEVREGIAGVNYNAAMNMSNLQKQIGDCCCENRAAIAQVRYDMANNTRDIIDSQNANTRAILDAMCQDKIDTLTRENEALRLKASQEAQNNALIAALKQPCPIPAYVVANPNCCTQTVQSSCGCGGNAYGFAA